jgi:hypothetical protein
MYIGKWQALLLTTSNCDLNLGERMHSWTVQLMIQVPLEVDAPRCVVEIFMTRHRSVCLVMSIGKQIFLDRLYTAVFTDWINARRPCMSLSLVAADTVHMT